MLPSEIEPYAQAHIEAVQNIRTEMLTLTSTHDSADISRDQLMAWAAQLLYTITGFLYFQACMTDEVNQKKRLYDKALDCRLHHK